jgi:hypothetical protein
LVVRLSIDSVVEEEEGNGGSGEEVSKQLQQH